MVFFIILFLIVQAHCNVFFITLLLILFMLLMMPYIQCLRAWTDTLYNNNNNNTLFQTIVHMDNKKNKKQC